MLVTLLQVRHPVDDDGGADHRGQADVIGPSQPPQLYRAGAEEGAGEHPDAERAAQGRQRPGSHLRRHDLGQVGLAGQSVDRASRPEQQHPEAEHRQRQPAVAEVDQAQDQAGHRHRRGHQHRLPFADAGGEDARGNVGHQRANAEQRGDERRDRGARTAIDRAQRDDRQHRPFREPEQGCRAERGDSHRTKAEFLTHGISALVRHPGCSAHFLASFSWPLPLPTGARSLGDSAAMSREAPASCGNHALERYTHRQRREDLARPRQADYPRLYADRAPRKSRESLPPLGRRPRASVRPPASHQHRRRSSAPSELETAHG